MRTEPRLEDLLDSLEAQTFKDFEHIIVDGKLDRIPGRMERWRAQQERRPFPIKVVGDKPCSFKLGLANARNSGVIWADGRIVLYIDDHITFEPGLLAGHMAHHIGPPKAIAGIAHYHFPDKVIIDNRVKLVGGDVGLVKCRIEWLYGMNASVPMEKILQVNGSDERYCGEFGGEDCDLSIRLARAECRPWLDTKLVVHERRDVDTHEDLFVTEGVGHEDWWNERTKRFHWRNERFIEELVYSEIHRSLSKNPWNLREARGRRIAGATTWDDILRGA